MVTHAAGFERSRALADDAAAYAAKLFEIAAILIEGGLEVGVTG